METRPLLSLCIPTYNRANYLRASLESLVVQPEISSPYIEILVSDNASEDGTQSMVEEIAQKHPSIRYFRNETNINDRNFPLALTRARGEFRRLLNDNLLHLPGSLGRQLELVQSHRAHRPRISFYNRALHKGAPSSIQSYDSLDPVVHDMGLWLTSIATFGLWEEELAALVDPFAGCETKLWQVSAFMEIGAKHSGHFLLCQETLHSNQAVAAKDLSYGLFTVFHTNFLGLLQPHVGTSIQQETVDSIEKELLLRFFSDRIVDFRLHRKKYRWSDTEDLLGALKATYRKKPYYWRFHTGLFLKMIQEKLGSFNTHD